MLYLFQTAGYDYFPIFCMWCTFVYWITLKPVYIVYSKIIHTLYTPQNKIRVKSIFVKNVNQVRT